MRQIKRAGRANQIDGDAVARATEVRILFAATTLAGRKLNEVEGSHLHGKPTHRG
jgi:hypothetical protein